MEVQDVTGRAVSQVKKIDIIQTSNVVLFWKFSLVLLITLPPTELCFSTLDEVGNHLYVADRSICDQDQDVVK